MDLPELGTNLLNRVPPRLLSTAERYLKNIPLLRERLAKETDSMLADLEGGLKPYRGQVPTHTRLPEQGLAHEEVLREMEQLHAREEDPWDVRTSWYERRKRALTLAALPHERYAVAV